MAKKYPKKIRLKRAKEDKALKSQMRRDIAQFLTDMHYCISPNIGHNFMTMLRDGHKGYFNLRNKELIGELEDAYQILHRPYKERIKFYAYLEDGGSVKYGAFRYRDIDKYSDKLQEEIHSEFQTRAECHVLNVMDAIIGLEREDEEGPSSGKAYKRGLPTPELDDSGCDF